MDLTHTCQNESGRVTEDNKQSSHRTANGHIPIPTFNAAKEAKNVRYYSFVGTYYLFIYIPLCPTGLYLSVSAHQDGLVPEVQPLVEAW